MIPYKVFNDGDFRVLIRWNTSRKRAKFSKQKDLCWEEVVQLLRTQLAAVSAMYQWHAAVSPPCITADRPIHQMYGFSLNALTKVSQSQLSFSKLSCWHWQSFSRSPTTSKLNYFLQKLADNCRILVNSRLYQGFWCAKIVTPHQLDISNVKLTQISCKIAFWAKIPEHFHH